MDTDEGPGEVYRKIKLRLFRFLETSTEKQSRVKNEWNNLTKTRGMSALQFEAEWEQIHAELDEVGLTINPLEKFLAYIIKVGPQSETIRTDRRPRADGAGGLTTRLPESSSTAPRGRCRCQHQRGGHQSRRSPIAGRLSVR